jgi:uncharacterized protein YndB with AHSA1/START domain/DNA-binding transcriptional ArsR family regulator
MSFFYTYIYSLAPQCQIDVSQTLAFCLSLLLARTSHTSELFSLLTCDHLVTYNTHMAEEHVFKALADHHRRNLLDLLYQNDGQTLGELCAHLPMTRYGVMKHLQVLEQAQLITTRKVGREKFHYLNPIPLQQVYDRWVSKYAQPFAHTLVQLKQKLENPPMTEKHSHVYSIFIRTTPKALWQALTDGAISQQYYFNSVVTSTWEKGDPYRYVRPTGELMLEGEVLEIDPPHKLVTTFRPQWDEATKKDRSVVTYEIEQKGDLCKLTLIHDNPDGPVGEGFKDGWSQILSALKTLLETGQPLVVAV